jgi:TetR/AcrR family transcriptional regulator, cholesterol catabolism regulator
MGRAPSLDTKTLVAAAAEVFSKKGYRNTTIDDIALAAKISRPTVYKYIKSKQRLLDLIVAQVTQFLSETAQKVIDDDLSPPAERLRQLLRVHVQAGCANRTLYQIVLHDEAELSPASRRRFRDWAHQVTADMKKILDECIVDQVLPSDLDAVAASNLLLSMTTNLYMWYDPRGPLDPDGVLEQLLLVIRPLAQSVRSVPILGQASSGTLGSP